MSKEKNRFDTFEIKQFYHKNKQKQAGLKNHIQFCLHGHYQNKTSMSSCH